jgi:glycosyltransferase involved in cell wall biosynthesis
MSDRERRPRVIHVITRLIVGGAQLSTISLCEGLRDHFDVRIVAGPQTGAEGSLHRRAAEAAPLTIIEALRREISPRWDPVAVQALRRLLRRLDGDIVHTHSSKAGIVGRFAAAPMRARSVHTVHGWGHTPADPPLRRAAFIALERAAARRCDALIAVSADNRTEGLAHGIGLAEMYHVIPALVDLNPLDNDFAGARARARKALGIEAHAEVIGWVGRFVDQKDPSTLSRAVATLLLRRPSSRAVLTGDGLRRRDVEAALDAAGVRDRVTFTGVVDGARKLMPAFDVLLHSSRWEGQPLVIQEALAERLPVVAARTSGVAELITNGTTGFIVSPQAPLEMADAAAAVLDTPALKPPLGDDVLSLIRATHGGAAVVRRHQELYEAILKGSQ